MTVTARPKLLLFVFLLMFLWVEVAEARLFRSSGRAERADVYSETFFYVNNQYLNDVGILTTAINSGQTVDSIAPFVSRGGGAEGLDAVPSECVNGFSRFDEADVYAAIDRLENDLQNNIITQAEYDTELAEQQAIIANDPCVWEFEQGEDLFTWGAFNLYFNNPEVNYDVSWNIIGQGKTWDNLAGTINTDPALVDPSDPGAAIEFGSVMLNMAAPVDLLPGDYQINVEVSMSSVDGQFFYATNKTDDEVEIQELCIDNPLHGTWVDDFNAMSQISDNATYNAWLNNNPEPDSEICGYNSAREVDDANYVYVNNPYLEYASTPTFFWSDFETLRILPSSNQNAPTPDPVDVNAPASISLFAIGGLGILLRRRSIKRNNNNI